MKLEIIDLIHWAESVDQHQTLVQSHSLNMASGVLTLVIIVLVPMLLAYGNHLLTVIATLVPCVSYYFSLRSWCHNQAATVR
jgi:predicted ABC-type exoprotein transport system permease subunit